MKQNWTAILLFTGIIALSTGCVSVGINNTNILSNYGAKVERLFVVVDCKGEYNAYFNGVVKHMRKFLIKEKIAVTTYVAPQALETDQEYQKQLNAFLPCHVLTINKSHGFKNQDEGHIDEDATLDVKLHLANSTQNIWRSSISVTSGGVLGFGTISNGQGGKLTAQKIYNQMKFDKVIL